ncbi:hypothetical protein LOZ39_003025 [Ophidiomyces ophidiicola]|nr:hypothetical protein LOZ49_003347 [Ophidiomyces ophidiicola]KAI2076127.1 hypothetical protein LOZ39_003025 [Ophidiomyces ophidiicola]KAI2084631.1 hypothetical protein LOZ36_004641 [Ophidiomyces ophidiicola]KAI2145885.1 hypothetical protein LOZ29_000312 [Ophidiomyces ophidiicola]KAI2146729.1 hypothetical protein LOZ28_000648 [Ophidiomyces ophidiicola]
MEILPPLISLASACIVYPLTVIVSIAYFLLELLASPIVHLSSQVYRIFALLVRGVLKFEPLYTYFGVAGLFGAITGFILYRILCATYQLLGISPCDELDLKRQSSALEPADESASDEHSFTNREKGFSRLQKLASKNEAGSSRWFLSPQAQREGILEEGDEEEKEEDTDN